MKIWSKTILNIYRYLERVANAIDKIVLSRAINSFFTSSSNMAFNGVWNVSQDIINLTNRKVNLINLKLITEKALSCIDEALAKVLILNFVEKRTCYECAEILNVSLRTYFRKLNKALESFSKALNRQKYDEKYFDNMLASENWILEVKNKLTSNQDIFEMNGKFAKKICCDLKKNKILNNVTLQFHNNLSL